MRVVLSALGSRGDVHPVLAIASALQRRDHEVVVCIPDMFVEHARAEGLTAEAFSVDMVGAMRSFTGGVRGLAALFRFVSDSVAEQFELLARVCTDADLLVSTTIEFAAPSIAEYHGIPHFRIAYAPVIPGRQAPPMLPWQDLSGRLNRQLWHGINLATRMTFSRPVNRGRRSLGLAVVSDIARHLAAGSTTLLTIDETLSPPENDWNVPYTYTGYCHDSGRRPLDEATAAFLADGPSPIYIGMGSMTVSDADALSEQCVRAVQAIGARAIVQAGWSDLGRRGLPETIHRIDTCDHLTLFPEMAGVVHHGGSGTTHAALRAGVPQMALPQIADQFHWGKRIHACGLGPKSIPLAKLTDDGLRRALARLLDGAELRDRARAHAASIREQDGVANAVAAIEGVV
jgi:UDP:flavonoid glycosyltransferase YjiC (YdhE family)